MPRQLFHILTACLVIGGTSVAQTLQVEDPAHNELRALRTELLDAVGKGDIDRIVASTHPTVVITWQNNEVCRGHQGVRDFFLRTGKQSFKGYKLPPTPDDLTILHGGDMGIATGKTIAQYNLLGSEHELESRWTATLVKENGRWLLAGYHLSMNVLDNALLNAAKSGLIWAAVVAGILGLALGWILFGRKRANRPA